MIDDTSIRFGLRLRGAFWRCIALACFATGVQFADISPAAADFRVCNDTKSLVGVALGYREKNEWITEGWWQIPGETCASLVEGTLSSRYFYIYAEDADRGGQWRGDVFMCTADEEFRIQGISECFARGFQKAGYFEVDTGDKESWMVRLTESGQSSSAAE